MTFSKNLTLMYLLYVSLTSAFKVHFTNFSLAGSTIKGDVTIFPFGGGRGDLKPPYRVEINFSVYRALLGIFIIHAKNQKSISKNELRSIKRAINVIN